MNTSWPGSLHVAPVCTPPRPVSRLRVMIHACICTRVCTYTCISVLACASPGVLPPARVLPTVGATNLNTHVDACEDCTYTAYPPEPTSRCQTNTHNTARLATRSRVHSMLAQAMYVICRQLRPPRSYQTRIGNRNRDRHRPPSSFRRVIADVSANATSIFQCA